jgi:hypothetical protein
LLVIARGKTRTNQLNPYEFQPTLPVKLERFFGFSRVVLLNGQFQTLAFSFSMLKIIKKKKTQNKELMITGLLS